jgi:hypothetical protein
MRQSDQPLQSTHGRHRVTGIAQRRKVQNVEGLRYTSQQRRAFNA